MSNSLYVQNNNFVYFVGSDVAVGVKASSLFYFFLNVGHVIDVVEHKPSDDGFILPSMSDSVTAS